MLSKRKKKWLAALAACAGGTLFQAVLPSGCANYALRQAVTSFDFCSVFNCEGSTFFDPCSPFVLLMDCPEFTQGTTTTP